MGRPFTTRGCLVGGGTYAGGWVWIERGVGFHNLDGGCDDGEVGGAFGCSCQLIGEVCSLSAGVNRARARDAGVSITPTTASLGSPHDVKCPTTSHALYIHCTPEPSPMHKVHSGRRSTSMASAQPPQASSAALSIQVCNPPQLFSETQLSPTVSYHSF